MTSLRRKEYGAASSEEEMQPLTFLSKKPLIQVQQILLNNNQLFD